MQTAENTNRSHEILRQLRRALEAAYARNDLAAALRCSREIDRIQLLRWREARRRDPGAA